MKLIIPTILLALSLFASADEKTFTADKITIAGREYEKVTIKLENAITASINHDAGGGRIPASKLPPEIQAAIGFDSTKAAEAETQLAAQAAKQKEKAAKDQMAEKLQAMTSTSKYQVVGNYEQGLIVYIFKSREVITNIPTGSSRVGGGGGFSSKTTTWENTYTQAFMPHTFATKNLANDHTFFAKVLVDGSTSRLMPGLVLPVHEVLGILDKQ